MSNFPTIRLVTLQSAIEDVNEHPRPFVVVNTGCHTTEYIEFPSEIFEKLPDGFTGDLLVTPTTLAELRGAGLPLGRHREQFLAGEFVLIFVDVLHAIAERAHGGQTVGDLEERARDGLRVTMALATERIRACLDLQEHRKLNAETRRGEIFARLEPYLAGFTAINTFREGQKSIEKWYPGKTAHQTMKSAYMSVAALPGARLGKVDLVAIENEQMDLVRTAGSVYSKTLAVLAAQHEMSDMLRELEESAEFKNATGEEQHVMMAGLLREKGPAQHQTLAHDEQHSPSLLQLMRAANGMNFNPAWVFLNMRAYTTELDFAMQLGCAERRIGAMFKPEQIARLKQFMALGETVDADVSADAEIQAAKTLRDQALRVNPQAGWDEFFAIAANDGGALWVTKAL
ncbi:MAG: hypothetical protein ACOY91_17625 [Pseudomonadota bacterium]